MANRGNRGVKLVKLADKQGPLKREDIICPICWSVLLQPVSLPCQHNLCLECFKKHVEETSLQCPCCRMRLSVWSRRAFRENNLVDTALWNRIQKEFPKLVQTRISGEDSQDLLPEDLVSVNDKNYSPFGLNRQPVSTEEESPKRFVRDGDFNSVNGEIRRELESTLRKHQEDIENQHRLEESASVDLIRQLQDHGELPKVVDVSVTDMDFKLARKLEEDDKRARIAEITARRKLFTEPGSSKRMSSLGTKLISEWTQNSEFTPNISNNSSSTIVDCRGTTTPKTSGKRPSLSSLSSRSLKKTKKTGINGLTRNSMCQKSSSQGSGSHSSQNSIMSYLSSSQQSPMSLHESQCSQVLLSPQPSTSAAAMKKAKGQLHESCKIDTSHPFGVRSEEPFSTSAFSPTKPSHTHNLTRLIPGGLHYKSVPNIINRFMKFSQEHADAVSASVPEDFCERDTSTPNSIDLEVNSHFRPIRSAPKTPPKRLSNGTSMPEHLIVKTTPVKVLPLSPADLEYAIRSDLRPSIAGKPNKIVSEDGKRVSDDSGRASVSSTGSDLKEIEVIEILSDSDSGCLEKSAVVSPIMIEEQFMEGNKDKSGEEVHFHIKSGETNVSTELSVPQILILTPAKRAIITDGLSDSPLPGPEIPTVGDYSPLIASDLQRENQNEKKMDLNVSSSTLKEEDDDDNYSLHPSQDSVSMSFAEMNAQQAEFERLRLKLFQEVEDLKFAKRLQRDMNRGIPTEKRHGLRSWLKKGAENSDSPSSK